MEMIRQKVYTLEQSQIKIKQEFVSLNTDPFVSLII